MLVDRLVEDGINFIDSARGYTVSEEYLGYALEGRREKFVLATKSMARTKEAMEADIEEPAQFPDKLYRPLSGAPSPVWSSWSR